MDAPKSLFGKRTMPASRRADVPCKADVTVHLTAVVQITNAVLIQQNLNKGPASFFIFMGLACVVWDERSCSFRPADRRVVWLHPGRMELRLDARRSSAARSLTMWCAAQAASRCLVSTRCPVNPGRLILS